MREKGKPGSILQRARDSRKSHWHAALQARDGPGASQTGVRGREAPGGRLPAFPGSPAGTEALAFVILGFGAASGLLRQGWMLGPGWPGGVGSPVRELGGGWACLTAQPSPAQGRQGRCHPRGASGRDGAGLWRGGLPFASRIPGALPALERVRQGRGRGASLLRLKGRPDTEGRVVSSQSAS